MKQQKIVLILGLIVCTFFKSEGQNLITVYPNEYTDALSNPLKGFRPNTLRSTWPQYPYSTLARHYVKWSDVESSASDDYTKLVDYANTNWGHLPAKNIKVIPRIYADWDSASGNEYWPADILQQTGLQPNDPALWRTQIVKDRLVALIQKMGQAWNNDPRIAWIQTGLVGYWGEQEKPVGVDEENYTQILGDAFRDAFPNKMLLVRNQKGWDLEGHKWGVYWDSFAHPGQQNGAWAYIRSANSQDRYLTEVIEGEVGYNWGESVFDPLYGGEPTITLGNDEYTDNMIDVIRELHASGLGWIAHYDVDGSYGTDPNTVINNANRMQKEFGYRFTLPEFSCSERTDGNRAVNLAFKVKNTGSAPFYGNWPLAVVLIDETTHQIVWKDVLKGIDVTLWEPGDVYDYTSRTYQNPAPEYSFNAAVTIPNSVPNGQYMIGLTILEPYSQTPGVFFAIENFLASSQTQPLMRIGVGEDIIGSHDVNLSFDDPVADDTRYYATTPQGTMYSVSTTASVGGTIKPTTGSYLENTTVTLRAYADEGYQFSGWSGDLSGTTNPQSIIMDSNKSVSANFTYVGIPTYQDKIHSVAAPNQVFPNQYINVAINYEASESRDITCAIQKNSSPWTNYGNTKVTVAKGTRTDQLYFRINSGIPLAIDAYNIVVNLLPIGQSWSNRLDEAFVTNVDAVKTLSNKEFSKSEISVFPNPANTFAMIKSETIIKSISLYSVKGELLFNKNIESKEFYMDISLYSSGLYLLYITNEKGRTVSKLLIN